jgi:hypothetical protein
MRRVRPIRRVGVFLALAAALLMALPSVAAVAVTGNTVSIQAAAPPVAVAGDMLAVTASFTFTCTLCGTQVEHLTWVGKDGQTHTTSRPAGGISCTTSTCGTSMTDVWATTIPGDDVLYPSVRYYFWATEATSTGTLTAYAPGPGATYFSVPVNTTLRFTLTEPDGSAAINVPVTAWGTTAQAYWHTATDAQGHGSITLPSTDAWLASVATGQKQASILLYASDGALPSGSAMPGAPITYSTNWRSWSVQLNLGRPALPAQPSLQDYTIYLHPGHNTMYNAADTPAQGSAPQPGSTCLWQADGSPYGHRECWAVYDAGTQPVPVGQNLGGGIDTQGQYTYTDNSRTKTTSGFSAGAGNWTEAGGETTAENSSTVSQQTAWKGPNDKHGYDALIDYEFDQHTQCPYKADGSVDNGKCTYQEALRPYGWGGGTLITAAPYADYFDQACDPATSHGECDDYTEHLYGTYTASVAYTQGHEWTFEAQASPYDFVTLHASTSYGSAQTTTVIVSFKPIASPTRANQFVFVPEGTLSRQAPSTNPEFTYTASSNSDLTNTAAQDPAKTCVTCYTGPLNILK